ncbi:Glycoside hydrolase, clan GH-D [Penicillium camemberti]|uniref:Alpha-galactosidase n=1 Tax=Penicillium camemberti (strain FM 013) TaxID=1429867 RepID=A0A0G4P5C7_PENC3|nr:Glycoside hydrolase, clan GH-D [Penicillium camemberti]
MKSLSASWAAWSMAIFPAPPMVFSNWACFKCDLNGTFTEAAMAMLKRGLDIGYDRLTLDDCWMVHDCVEDGSLEWDTDKFPHGIPWLANYMKSNGLHLGIYQDPGLRIRRVGASLGGLRYQQPGYDNDPDFLIAGQPSLSWNKEKDPTLRSGLPSVRH